jgi:hypothetical protein
MIICIVLLLANGLIFVPDDIPDSQKVAGGAIMLTLLVVVFTICLISGVKKMLQTVAAASTTTRKGLALAVSSSLDTAEILHPQALSAGVSTQVVSMKTNDISSIKLLARQLQNTVGREALEKAISPPTNHRVTGISFSVQNEL